jgi:quercetin dioxygenase-like cupin family protein
MPENLSLPNGLTLLRQTELKAALAPPHFGEGSLWAETVLMSKKNAEITAMRVTYTPGARTAWHSHPRGQLLIIAAGVCLVQRKGGDTETVQAGDFVWIGPNECHWHGAPEAQSMTYVSIQQVEDERFTDWECVET